MPTRITIVGLGLIGGSLAAASRRAFPKARIVGVTRSRGALSYAKKRNWIDEGFRDLEKVSPPPAALSRRWGDLVILCTPVDTLRGFLERLDRFAPRGTVVTDTGSVKGFLVRWAEKQQWRRITFIGAHPMAGSHERGIEHARANLFKGSLTFVTPGRDSEMVGATQASPLRVVKHFWRKISGRVTVVPPETHDALTGEISHLPHFLASLLVASVSGASLRFATSGFLDTTRVAQADPGIWVPIFFENRKELNRALRNFEQALRRAQAILKTRDRAKLKRLLTQVQTRRASLEASDPFNLRA